MSDHYSSEQKIARGERAARLLEDDLLTEAQASARGRLVEEWIASSDPQEQYAAWAKMHALDALPAELRRIMNEGIFEAEALRRRGPGKT